MGYGVSQLLPVSLLRPEGAGGSSSGSAIFTLSGVSFVSNGTLFVPANFQGPDGTPRFARLQTWGGGASAVNATGAGGGGGYSEDTVELLADQAVAVAAAAAVGANGNLSSVGALALARGGNSPGTAPAGQGGQASTGIGSIKFNGGNGNQGGGNQDGGGGAGSQGAGGTPAGGVPNGGQAHLPGALSIWPGGGGGSTAGSANLGRPGFVRTTFLQPSLELAPRVISDVSEQRDLANALSRNVPPPARAAGDLLVLCTTARTNPTITAAGWATGTLAQQTGTGSAIAMRAFYRIATGTAADTAAVATTLSVQTSSQMIAVRGATGNPSWSTATGNSSAITPVAHSIGGYRPCLAIRFLGANQNNGVNVTVLPADFGGTLVTPGATDQGAMTLTAWSQFYGSTITPDALANASVIWTAGTLIVPGG